jgi:AraC family transcriptional regulator
MVETVYPPGEELPWHRHESPYLLVVLGGALLERAVRRDNDCARGTLVFNSSGEPHRDRIGHAGARCLNIELGPRWLEPGDRRRRTDETAAYRFAGAALDAVGWLEAAFRRSDGACKMDVESSVHRLLDAALGAPRVERCGEPGWMRDVVSILHDETRGAPEIGRLAAAAGVHPAHLCRTFAARHGCTIGQYARRLRADRAMQQILHTREPLARVAQDAGFTDQSHLTRAIRAFYRTTPARLRRESGRA